jgi:hypothetical protein
MAVFPNRADDALQAAITKQQCVAEYNEHRLKKGDPPIQIGVGLHTGHMMVGVVGEVDRICEPVERLLSSFFGSLDKRDDFIHECLVQNTVRLPDHERKFFAEQNVSGKFQITSLAFLFGIRFVGNSPSPAWETAHDFASVVLLFRLQDAGRLPCAFPGRKDGRWLGLRPVETHDEIDQVVRRREPVGFLVLAR